MGRCCRARSRRSGWRLLAEGDIAGAEAILGSPDDVFDANIPALLATRPDRDRYADWRSGLLHSLGARDSVNQYDPAFAETLNANLGGLPLAVDAEGLPVYTATNAQNRASPFFFGPDGVRDTFDDLPFVLLNAQGQAAGYALASPIQGTLEASFDGTFRAGPPGTPVRPIYSATAQIFVPSASNPSASKLVELYGVYSDAFLINQGCFELRHVSTPRRDSASKVASTSRPKHRRAAAPPARAGRPETSTSASTSMASASRSTRAPRLPDRSSSSKCSVCSAI